MEEGGGERERERKRGTGDYGHKGRKSEVGRPLHKWVGTYIRMGNTLVDQAFDIKIFPSRTHSTKF